MGSNIEHDKKKQKNELSPMWSINRKVFTCFTQLQQKIEIIIDYICQFQKKPNPQIIISYLTLENSLQVRNKDILPNNRKNYRDKNLFSIFHKRCFLPECFLLKFFSFYKKRELKKFIKFEYSKIHILW